jgi:hypothetical protein
MTDAQKAKKKKEDNLKAATPKVKRLNQQKEDNKYVEGNATKGTNVDLSTFKVADVVKWTKSKPKKTRTSSAGKLAFGGSSLRGIKKLHRKKNNRIIVN